MEELKLTSYWSNLFQLVLHSFKGNDITNEKKILNTAFMVSFNAIVSKLETELNNQCMDANEETIRMLFLRVLTLFKRVFAHDKLYPIEQIDLNIADIIKDTKELEPILNRRSLQHSYIICKAFIDLVLLEVRNYHVLNDANTDPVSITEF